MNAMSPLTPFTWTPHSPLVIYAASVFPPASLIAAAIAEQVDKRVGLKCECGQSLTMGRHTARLMREGGKCPRCERVVVESET